MKMKKFLASVLAALMTISSMSFIASAQETETDATLAETVEITFNRRNGSFAKTTTDKSMYATITASFEAGQPVTFPASGDYIYHTFKGWSTEIDGEVIADLSTVTATAPTTYYGVWEWTKEDDGTPLDSITRAANETIANEGSKDGGTWYDAVAGVVYKTINPKTVGSTGSANMYSSLRYSIPGTSLYMAALVRTNMTGATTSVTAGIYNTSNKDGGNNKSQWISGSPVKTPDEWTVMILGSDTIQNFGIGTHIDFDLTGNDPADDLDNDYYDIAGMALFASKDDAEAWDLYAQNAYQGTAKISFDAQITEDDDTDVYTEYPTDLENDGNALVGWTLDPTAAEIEYVDLTKLPLPEEDVTYYAVWSEERTINFYKNDGTDAVETFVLGKGAPLTAPTFASEGKKFIGWALDAEGTELVEVPATAEDNEDYYAIWRDFWFTKLIVNDDNFDGDRTNGHPYGIDNLQDTERFDIILPYGYHTDVIPTLTVEGNKGTVTYTAPESIDGEGKITVAYDGKTVDYPVTFTVADKSSVTDLSGVPTGAINSDGRGMSVKLNNTDYGIAAAKFIPVYTTDSENYVEGKFTPDKSIGIEGWDIFQNGGFNTESYSQFRALVYYDDGGDGMDVAKPSCKIVYSAYGTRGTVKNTQITAANQPKTNRWEYIYYNLDDTKYGWTKQPHFYLFGTGAGKDYKNDVFYVASIDLLVDADEKFLQYIPVGLNATNETSAKNDGTIKGVTSDMEVAIGDGEYALVTTFEGYDADMGVLGGLAPATYYVRYAGDDAYAASEAVELLVAPDSIEIYYDDGNDSTGLIEQKYDYNEAIVLPEDPAKAGYTFEGWALGDAEEAYDFTDAKATSELDGVTFKAIWERITTIYVNGSAAASGDGYTAETALTSLADAWALVSDVDSTIIITGNTDLKGNLHANGGNVTIKGVTGTEVLTHAKPNFNGVKAGKITFENITIVNPTQWSNFWNFHGMEVEFGENITVPVDKANGKWPIVARAGGESGATLGRKIVLKSGEFSTFHLGSKGNVVNADVDFELLGGKATINLGNDSVGGQQVTTHGGTMQNIKARFEVQPVNVYMQWIHTMTGALQIIANNGVSIDKIEMNGVVPQGGTWKILSAEGGRADFTDTIGTYKFTTDKTYIVITDAEGESTKYRAADGVTGDAELYGEESVLEIALEAGNYTVSYTDEGVSVYGEFFDPSATQNFTLNADNNYSVTAGDMVIGNAESRARKGYKFSGEFATLDGKYETVNGTLTVTEYTDEYIELHPVYVEDDTLPYYYTTALYDETNETVDVTVAIANGKFTAGTVGIVYDEDVLEFVETAGTDDTGIDLTDATEIANNAPENAKVAVWHANAGSIDATDENVAVATFRFKVLDADADAIQDAVDYYAPAEEYEEYFAEGYYKVSPVNAEGDDPYAVSYVDVFLGGIELELVPTEPATITVKVTMPDKAGATTDDIAYLAYAKEDTFNWSFIALEEEGNEEATIEAVISDVFFVGETYDFTIVKNGYAGSEIKKITIADGMTLETTIFGGDIKESFEGTDADAVDMYDFGDGEVTLADFVRVVRGFDAEATEEFKGVVDINEDGVVNVTDVAIVKANYGRTFEEVEISIS